METLSTINFLMAAVFAACYCYQVVFAVARLLKKRRRFTAQKLCRYAVLIAARNESAVIAQLLESIRGQNYPQDLVHIYVVADNCTDNTAQIAAACGARVFQRQNKLQVGKGFALRFLLQKIQEEYPQEHYDGYFVFDADNLLDPRYITEMNKVFSSGNRVVTSYRNTKNYDDNWITAGYGLWFLRESEYLNRPRDYLGTSCAVSGTGFLFYPQPAGRAGRVGLLPPHRGFGVHRRPGLPREKSPIATTPSSTTSSPPALPSPSGSAPAGSGLPPGGGQARRHMVKTMLCDGSFACFDMLMCTIPAVVLSVISLLLNGVMFVVGVTIARKQLDIFFASVIMSAVNSYLVMLLMGLLPLVTEWRRIRCSRGKKIGYLFTFPFFVFTFGIAMVLAVFGNIEWKPIKHSVALSIGDMGSVSPQELRKIRKGRKL
ncbi:MAG: glycosyltransferase family 2 protein [Acutalibacter sp.]